MYKKRQGIGDLMQKRLESLSKKKWKFERKRLKKKLEREKLMKREYAGGRNLEKINSNNKK